MAGMVCNYNTVVKGTHDQGYKEMWKREREAAIARGEDPDAKVAARLAEKKEKAPLKKLQRLLHKEKGYAAGGCSSRLTQEEEDAARARDKERMLQEDDASMY
ncbi:hypothetical protein MMC19_005528 [Ptychographa xylographoides]|nr:hypothetical protein [Ptychographa xylographoides]